RAFVHRGGGEIDGGRGDGVDHVGGRRAAADGEALEVVAGDAGDVRGQAGGVAVDVLAVAGRDGQRAGGGAIGNADIALVGVDGGHTLRGAGEGGREHVARPRAFVHRGGGEIDGGRGDGVDHVGGRRAAADGEALEVAAGDAGDVRGQAGGVAVYVLAVARRDGQRAGGGAIGNGDIALVGVDGGHTLRGVGEGGREHVARTRAFVHRGGGEIDGGRGDGVDHVGGRRAAADGEALEVAAGDAGDVRGQAGGVAVDVLAV